MGKGRGFKKGCLWTLFGVAALSGVFISISVPKVDFVQTSWRVDEAVADYKATGLPWVAADMDRGVADSDNGAKTFWEAMALGQSSGRKDNELALAWRDGDISVVEAVLEDLEPSLDKYVEASYFQYLDFHRDWDMGPSLLFKELLPGKTAAGNLGLRAKFKASRGDLEGALADLRAGYRLGVLLGQEQFISATLVETGLMNKMLGYALEVAALRPDDEEWIAQVREEISGWESQADLGNALRGEAMMGLGGFRYKGGKLNIVRSDMGSDDVFRTDHPMVEMPNSVGADGIPTAMTNRAYLVRFLEAFTELHRLSEEFEGDPVGLADAYEKFRNSEIAGQKEWSKTMADAMLPELDLVGLSVAMSKYEPRAAEALLRAAEIRARTGQFPEGLSEFAGDLEEPVAGGSPGYVVKDGVAMLYWFGSNRRDDGGVRDFDSGKDDRSFRFPPERTMSD